MRKAPRGQLAQRLASCELAPHVRPGLGALGGHRDTILEASRARATDSLSFDDVVRDSETFDYLIGIPAAVVALEVHPAQTHEVKRIVLKKRRTAAFLSARGCSCPIARWFWAPTRGVHLRSRAPNRMRLLLEKNGIAWPVGQIDLRQL